MFSMLDVLQAQHLLIHISWLDSTPSGKTSSTLYFIECLMALSLWKSPISLVEAFVVNICFPCWLDFISEVFRLLLTAVQQKFHAEQNKAWPHWFMHKMAATPLNRWFMIASCFHSNQSEPSSRQWQETAGFKSTHIRHSSRSIDSIDHKDSIDTGVSKDFGHFTGSKT